MDNFFFLSIATFYLSTATKKSVRSNSGHFLVDKFHFILFVVYFNSITIKIIGLKIIRKRDNNKIKKCDETKYSLY